MNLVQELVERRFTDPGAMRRALLQRRPAPTITSGQRILVIAADHPARGCLAASGDEYAMASREQLLQRCLIALARPGVTGFLGTPDLIEDLALLGALDEKLLLGSMNRAGLRGAAFEVDDRLTAYDATGIVESGLDGGKLLLRVDPDDPASPAMLERCARAIDALSACRKLALIEPFLATRVGGFLENDMSPEAVIRASAIASALGRTSAWTWLKLPAVADMERVVGATTLPCLLLGGEVPVDVDTAIDEWSQALRLPNVKGMVIGRALLFPSDGDVAAAVDRVVEVL